MNKKALTGIFVILSFQIMATCAWEIDQDWTLSQSPTPSSAMAFVQDVLVSAGSNTLQFWSSTKELLKKFTLDGDITAIVVHPDTDVQYIYVSTKAGSIYSYYPPGHDNELTQAAQKTYPYELYANAMLWIGNSRILAVGASRLSNQPQYYLYQTLTDGSLAFKQAVSTSFMINTQVTAAAVNANYTRVAFYSPDNQDNVDLTINETVNDTTMGSNIQEYSLQDHTLSDKYDDASLTNNTNDGTLAFIADALYVFEKTENRLFEATDSGLVEKTIYNRTDLTIQGIHQSIYSDQIVLSTIQTENNMLYLNYFKQMVGLNEIEQIAYIEISDRNGQQINTIAFNPGMTALGVGFENAGQQTYRGGTPVAAYVAPIAAILGVGLIAGIVLLVKGGSASGAAKGGEGMGSEAQMKGDM